MKQDESEDNSTVNKMSEMNECKLGQRTLHRNRTTKAL